MKEYTVPFRQSCWYCVTVEANNKDEAELIAYNHLPDDIFDWSDFEIEADRERIVEK